MTIFSNIVNKKINEYREKYHHTPKYLKIPLWFICKMQNEYKFKVSPQIAYPITFKNLILCETLSISNLEEMEVF